MPPRYTPDEYRQRPKVFDAEVAWAIVDRVSNGEVLTEMCREDRDLPLPATFLRWVREDRDLAEAYAVALEDRNDLLVEEIIELSSGRDPKQSRVEVDARRFVVERTSPEKYGQRSYLHQRSREDADSAGVDHVADVRRRIAEMAKRIKQSESA